LVAVLAELRPQERGGPGHPVVRKALSRPLRI